MEKCGIGEDEKGDRTPENKRLIPGATLLAVIIFTGTSG